MLKSLPLPARLAALLVALALAGCNAGGIFQEKDKLLNPTDVTPSWLSFRAVDICLDGPFLYVATEQDGLIIYNVSDTANPRWVGSVKLRGLAQLVTEANGYAYVMADGFLEIVDARSPSHPYIASEVDLHLYGNSQIDDICYSRGCVYIAADELGLFIVDVDPVPSAHLASTLDTPGQAVSVIVSNGYALLDDAQSIDEDTLLIVDVRDPESPSIVRSIADCPRSRELRLSEGRVYAATSDGLAVFDIDLPDSVKLAGIVETGSIYQLEVAGGYAYLPAGVEGLRIWDISPLESASVVCQVDTPNGANEVAVSGTRACVLDTWGGYYYGYYGSALRVIDVPSPETAYLAGSIEPLMSSDSIAIAGDCAYVTEGGSLRILDISPPETAHEIGKVTVLDAIDVVSDGEYAYVLGQSDAIRIFDVKPAETAHGVHIVGVEASGSPALAGNRLYLPSGDHLKIIDISSPVSAHTIASVAMEDYIREIDEQGGYVYAASYDGTIMVTDVDPPESAHIVGAIETGHEILDIDVSGDYAYVCYWGGLLAVVDIRQPDSGRVVATIDLMRSSTRERLAVNGNFAFVSSYDKGLQIVDISRPESPRLAAMVALASGGDIAVSGDYVYMACGDNGVRIVRLW